MARRTVSEPVPTSLPFEDPDQAPPNFRKALWTHYWLPNCFWLLSIPVGTFLLIYGLLWSQGSGLARDDSIALITGENFIFYLCLCSISSSGLFLIVWDRVLTSHPDFELFAIYQRIKKRSGSWDIAVLAPRMRRNRALLIRTAIWPFLVAWPLLFLGLDSYIHVSQSGIKVNSYWGLGETRYAWSDIKNAELSGVSNWNNQPGRFESFFIVQPHNGPAIELMRGSVIPDFTAFGQSLETARALRKNGVPVEIQPLNRDQINFLKASNRTLHHEARQFWRAMRRLPGVQIQGSTSSL